MYINPNKDIDKSGVVFMTEEQYKEFIFFLLKMKRVLTGGGRGIFYRDAFVCEDFAEFESFFSARKGIRSDQVSNWENEEEGYKFKIGYFPYKEMKKCVIEDSLFGMEDKILKIN